MPRRTLRTAILSKTLRTCARTRRAGRRLPKSRDPSVPGEPRYRFHNRSRQAVVTLSGHDNYLGAYGSDESCDRYRAAVGEWIARGRRPAEPDTPALSINELLLTYIGWAESYYVRDGAVNHKELWNVKRALRPLRELFGLTAARDFGPAKLEVVRDRLVAEGLARSIVNRYVGRIKHVFKLAVSKELLPAAVWQALLSVEGLKRGRTPAHEPEPIGPVDDAAVDATLPHLSPIVRAMVQVQRFTGMRPAETCAMRGVDIDRSAAVWTYTPEHHKCEIHGQRRTIPLGPRAQEIIWPFLRPGFLFSPRDAENERRDALHEQRKTPLSCGNVPGSNKKRRPERTPGEVYSPDAYRRAIHVACAKAFPAPAGLSDEERHVWQCERRWSPNRLRHSLATRIRHAYGLEAASAVLGHANPDTTLIYAERDAALAASIMAKIG